LEEHIETAYGMAISSFQLFPLALQDSLWKQLREYGNNL